MDSAPHTGPSEGASAAAGEQAALQKSLAESQAEVARLKELHLAEHRRAVQGWKEVELTLDQERADLARELSRLRDRASEQTHRIQEAGEVVESAKNARHESAERLRKARELEHGIPARVEEAMRLERAELARRIQEAVAAVKSAKTSLNESEERMKITSQEEYGLRCLLRLAQEPYGRSLTIPEIAASEGLSAPYVAKLLGVLRQAGLIDPEPELPSDLNIPGCPDALLVSPGILVVAGRQEVRELIGYLENKSGDHFKNSCAIPLVVLVDDMNEIKGDLMRNFLWITFTRSNPSHDISGVHAFTEHKHWGCRGSLLIDARIKPHHAPVLKEDPVVEERINRFFKPNIKV